MSTVTSGGKGEGLGTPSAWGRFAAAGTGALHKIDRITNKADYAETLEKSRKKSG